MPVRPIFTNLFGIITPVLLFLTCNTVFSRAEFHSKCEPITGPICSTVGYRDTNFPNSLGHKTQLEAQTDLSKFSQVVSSRCSQKLTLLLCSVYLPICLPNYPTQLFACQNVCEEVKSECASEMQQCGLQWPEQFNCSHFITREQMDGEPCLDLN